MAGRELSAAPGRQQEGFILLRRFPGLQSSRVHVEHPKPVLEKLKYFVSVLSISAK